MHHELNCAEIAKAHGSMHLRCRGRYFVDLLTSDFDIWCGRISMSVENTMDEQFELLFELPEEAHMFLEIYLPLAVCIDSHAKLSLCESCHLIGYRFPIFAT
jgi:hypothetical protein